MNKERWVMKAACSRRNAAVLVASDGPWQRPRPWSLHPDVCSPTRHSLNESVSKQHTFFHMKSHPLVFRSKKLSLFKWKRKKKLSGKMKWLREGQSKQCFSKDSPEVKKHHPTLFSFEFCFFLRIFLQVIATSDTSN